MKRVFGILLALCLLMLTAVQADATSDLLKTKILYSLKYSNEQDVSSCNLTIRELDDMCDELYYSGQLPWYAQSSYTYTYSEDIVQTLMVDQMDPDVYDRDLYERKMAEMLAETCLPGMTDWQKALSVHEYITLHTVYDESLSNYTGYDALVNGTAVCQGYSLLYMDAMNRLGIPCRMLPVFEKGEMGGHGWNLLQLDGQWYHVDTTWADPVSDIYGTSRHGYFLKTDAEYQTGSEHADAHEFKWNSVVTVAETPYPQDDFLEEITSSVCFVDANTVVFRREGEYSNDVVSRDLTTGEETTLYSFDLMEMDLGDGSYLYPTYGLNYWNGRVYFNREDAVLSMLPDGSDLQEVYRYPVEDQYLIGSMVYEGVLYLSLSDKDFNIAPMEVILEGIPFHRHSYVEELVPATCYEEGSSRMVCACGLVYNDRVLDQLYHEMQTTEVKAPSLLDYGEVLHRCIHCGYEEYDYTDSLMEETVDWILYDMDWSIALAVGILLSWIIRTIGRARRKKRK